MRETRNERPHRRWVRSLLVVILWLFTTQVVMADSSLPVGLQPESWPGMTVLKLGAAGLGLFLLIAGSRYDRFSVGVFLTGLLALAAFWPLSVTGYGVMVLVMVAMFAVLYLLYLLVPRLVTGAATLWLLPALYLLYLADAGSFSWNRMLAGAGVVAGAVLGAALPRIGTLVLSIGLGLVLIRGAWDVPLSFGMVLMVALGALVIQLADFFLIRNAHREPTLSWNDVRDDWGGRLLRATGMHAGMILGLLWFLSLSAPMISPTDALHLTRISRLAEEGGLSAPGLLSMADSFYLCGRPFPVGLLSPRLDFVDRLLLPLTGKNPAPIVHRMRTVKDESELAAIRKAMAITSKAMRRVGEAVRPGIGEADLAEIVDRTFRESGADGYAFPSIVGAGPRACLPHYNANKGTLTTGFVVVDIGCMVGGYCADMTRTFPVLRRYTPAQRELIEWVLQAKDAAVAELKPGGSYRLAARAARGVFEKAGLARFFLHSLGHFVGIEVHDPYADKLKPGMVVTVEPGLYMSSGTDVDPKYRQLGVRIEDTYLITETGCEPLTRYPQVPYREETDVSGHPGEHSP